MIDIISDLLRGPDNLSEQMLQAKSFWDGFFDQHRNDSVDDLAKALSSAQFKVENIFEDRYRGKELMPITALGSLYMHDDGWQTSGKRFPKKIIEAFAKSMCSLEVKGSAKRAASMYWLDED